MRRHPELLCIVAWKIDVSRVKGTTPEAISTFFEDLKRVLEEYNISIENIYNMDESGFAIGEIKASKYIIDARIRQ